MSILISQVTSWVIHCLHFIKRKVGIGNVLSLPETTHNSSQRCLYQKVMEPQDSMPPWMSIICQYGNHSKCKSINIHTQCTLSTIDSENGDNLKKCPIKCSAHYMSAPEWLIIQSADIGFQKRLVPAKPLIFANFLSESGSSIGLKCLILTMTWNENGRVNEHQLSNPWAYKERISSDPKMLDVSKIIKVLYRYRFSVPPFCATKDGDSGTWKTCSVLEGYFQSK